MITELAQLTVDPARAAAFEAAVAAAAAVFQAAPGCRGMRLERGVEDDRRYLLVVDWDTLDDHLVGFRGSAGFQQWRDLAGPFFTEPPLVWHVATVGRFF